MAANQPDWATRVCLGRRRWLAAGYIDRRMAGGKSGRARMAIATSWHRATQKTAGAPPSLRLPAWDG